MSHLENDSRTVAENIEVEVEDGRVTLSGKVSSPAARQAADDIDVMIDGVREVVNRISVERAEVGEA